MASFTQHRSTFDPLIQKESNYARQFQRWRGLFQQAATEMANLFKSFPGTGNFTQQSVQAAFAGGAALPQGVGGTSVFDPWNGWWCGTFHSAGGGRSRNYHIWDPTITHQGASIQLVSQSTTDFVPGSALASRKKANQVDLAINVHTSARGITGWVTKYQGGSVLELPHVGYYLNRQSVIWITQVLTPSTLNSQGNDFLMFFEWSSGSRRGGRYGIHGRSLSLAGNRVTPGSGPHWGEYRWVPANSNKSVCAGSGKSSLAPQRNQPLKK